MTTFRLPCLLVAGAALAWTGVAAAKIAPPQLTDEQKAAAAETAAKNAWADKVGNYKLCLAQDRVAEFYRKSRKDAGQASPAATPTAAPAARTPATTAVAAASPASNTLPACADPGPYASPAGTAKPLEAAGAHSPPTTAAGPPNNKAPAAPTGAPAKK